jgi:hypothetical protein
MTREQKIEVAKTVLENQRINIELLSLYPKEYNKDLIKESEVIIQGVELLLRKLEKGEIK